MRCPACGSEDYHGYGFCVNCGLQYPKETRKAIANVPVETIPDIDSIEQMRRSITIALGVVALFIVFFYIYLYLMGADPFLILMVEAFPLFWMVAILMRWRRVKQEMGRKGNVK
jgi:uncharacterized membrane protein YvbJ